MKNKLLAASLILLAAAILVKTGMVLALQPPITEVCKTTGGVLMDKNNCPAGAEKFPIGGIAGMVSGGNVGPGEIAFVDGGYMLKKDGTIWQYSIEEGQSYAWVENTFIKGKVETPVNQIIQWTSSYYMTIDGSLYYSTNDTNNPAWIKINDLIPTSTF